MPDKLTLLSVATPLAFVVAPPTLVPLSVKLTVLPETPALFEVSVALSVVVPPNVPVAAPTASEVDAALATSWKHVVTELMTGVADVLDDVNNASYLR